jgi:hypothetical protein
MLVTPRTYSLSQSPDRGVDSYRGYHPIYHSLTGWCGDRPELRRAAEMLLAHLAGSVRVGEVIRYVNLILTSALLKSLHQR